MKYYAILPKEYVDTNYEKLVEVMPTDINVDSDSKLILEHDGVEITGQKKNLIPIIADSIDDDGYNITKGIYSVQPIKTEQDIWVDRVRINTQVEQDDQVTVSFNVDDIQAYTQLQFDSHLSGGYILQNNNVKTLFGNQSIYGNGNIDLYVYTLQLTASFNGGSGTIQMDYLSSDNNKNVTVDSITKFTTLTKAVEGSIISCICSMHVVDHENVIGNNIRYESGVWYVYYNDTKFQYSYQGNLSNATLTSCKQLQKRTI